MPQKPSRIRAKIKPGYKRNGERKSGPPPQTAEERMARAVAKVEARHHITPSLVATMLLKHRGLLNGVARALKIPRATLTRYIDKHDDCLLALHSARDAMGDVAEAKLFQAIDAGDVRCILYYLSTVHRARGYGLRQDDTSLDTARGPVCVDTVNIVGIPSSTFLPKEIAAKDNMVVENNG